MPDEGRGYELIDGVLKARTVSKESSRVGVRLTRFLDEFIDRQNLGWVYGADMGFRCFTDPSRIRFADATFVSLGRMPVETYTDEGYCSTVPDLVVEVISPNDLAHEIEEKRDEWLVAGVRMVWIVSPETRSIYTHEPDGTCAFLRVADTLTAPNLLPDFAVPLADLFRKPGESAGK